MSTIEVLRAHEASALEEAQVVSRVAGKSKKKGKKSLVATGVLVAAVALFAILFSGGNLIPTAISERLVEETDVQYADAVASKILVFQEALLTHEVPANTVERLKGQGVMVGSVVNGEFVEGVKEEGELALKYHDKIIPAREFTKEVQQDAGLYKAFNTATYDRAAYYYDEAAELVFKKLGASRNNFNTETGFDEVMEKVMGEGSNVSVNNVGVVSEEGEDGETHEEYKALGVAVNAKTTNATNFVKEVAEKNTGGEEKTATMNGANALNIADTMTKEQRASLFYLTLMENISKMKAGEGSDSKISEAMNYLYKTRESQVVDVETGELTTVKGSMLEAPSLYAVLSGEPIRAEDVQNFAADRVLKTVENSGTGKLDGATMHETISSTGNKSRGTIGRLVNDGETRANLASLEKVTPTIDSSMINNGFETIGGIDGGELLVAGAVNVGAMLAQASGATAGDAEAAKTYARQTSDILALDAEADRLERSPFDASSPNTFLGSLVRKLAVGVQSKSLLSGFSALGTVFSNAFSTASGEVMADDQTDRYMANFGDCETLGSVGAVGTVGCGKNLMFDSSTLDDTFNNAEYLAFVSENTTLNESGNREIKKDSVLAEFIKFNNERVTPIGVMDGGILQSINNNSPSIPFISDIVSMVKSLTSASDEDKRKATGESYVYSSSNNDWSKYKYAQRYVSLARAAAALRRYDGDVTAYSNLPGLEGTENPVIAFLEDYYTELAQR